MKLVLIGDAESPHLLKWARALSADARVGDGLHVLSSRGIPSVYDTVVPVSQRLALQTRPDVAGGNVAILRTLPHVVRWLKAVQADWLHAHYLTSHGTLAWLAQRFGGVRGRIAASAWGSDVLVTPERSLAARVLLRRVLQAAAVTTSDSAHMAQVMASHGARSTMVFPFGLEALPDAVPGRVKEADLCFANRALEPVYQPERVAEAFAQVRAWRPTARLVVAHSGSRLQAMTTRLHALGCGHAVTFVGHLDAATQAAWYRRARWYLSLPTSDSVSVSLLEAMAHGCLPIVSDLPANRELVRDGDNGLVCSSTHPLTPTRLAAMDSRGDLVAQANHGWVAQHAMFRPCVTRFVDRLLAEGSQATR